MDREQIYQEIEHTLGLVPSFFKMIPDSTLELEWELFKKVQLDESPIPNKYRELIGLAIAGVTKCRYCAFYHTEIARLFGASEDAICLLVSQPLDISFGGCYSAAHLDTGIGCEQD